MRRTEDAGSSAAWSPAMDLAMSLLAVKAGSGDPLGTQCPEIDNTKQNQHKDSHTLNQGVVLGNRCQRNLKRTCDVRSGYRRIGRLRSNRCGRGTRYRNRRGFGFYGGLKIRNLTGILGSRTWDLLLLLLLQHSWERLRIRWFHHRRDHRSDRRSHGVRNRRGGRAGLNWRRARLDGRHWGDNRNRVTGNGIHRKRIYRVRIWSGRFPWLFRAGHRVNVCGHSGLGAKERKNCQHQGRGSSLKAAGCLSHLPPVWCSSERVRVRYLLRHPRQGGTRTSTIGGRPGLVYLMD